METILQHKSVATLSLHHFSSGMPAPAQISYAPRPSLPYSLSGTGQVALSASYKVPPTAATSAVSSYPSSFSVAINDVRHHPSTSYPSSNSYNDINHTVSSIGNRFENRNNLISSNNNSSNNSEYTIMPPKSLNIHPDYINSIQSNHRINANDKHHNDVAFHIEVGAPPIKRLKFMEKTKVEVIPPQLPRINTEQRTTVSSLFNNSTIEPISPVTSPTPIQNDEQSSCTQKETPKKEETTPVTVTELSSNPSELVDVLINIENEITSNTALISTLKIKQKEMEDTIASKTYDMEVDEALIPKDFKLVHTCLSENRKRAHESKQTIDKLGAISLFPIYNQPSDVPVLNDITEKYMLMRPKIIKMIKDERAERESREKVISSTYMKLSNEWRRKIERFESSPERKATEAKNRELFEKVFPELRKQREDKERFNRSGGRIKSEADLEEIMDGLQEQEMEDKKMRSYAVIPPLMLDYKQKRYTFVNENGKIHDFPGEFKSRKYINIWTQPEKDLFREKFLHHPKHFGIIASYIENKLATDCVYYYYHSKKSENYKKLLKKSRQRPNRTRNPGSKSIGAINNGLVMDICNTPGVTTRLQREQIQQQQRLEQPNSTAVQNQQQQQQQQHQHQHHQQQQSEELDNNADNKNCNNNNNNGNDNVLTSTIDERIQQQQSSTTSGGAKSPSNDHRQQTTTQQQDERLLSESTVNSTDHDVISETDSSDIESVFNSINKKRTNVAFKSDSRIETKRKERRKDDKKDNNTSDEECPTGEDGENRVKGGNSSQCVVCKLESPASRALLKSHAHQYGLKEEDVTNGARVCNVCRCKVVRSRYVHCPMPTCPNTKGKRVKRLRTLPARWSELSSHIKQLIVNEFQIPNGTTKCCTACFNRVQRRMSSFSTSSNSNTTDDKTTSSTFGNITTTSPTTTSTVNHQVSFSSWTEEETESLRKAITQYGTKWAQVCQLVSPTKTQHQCKNFYFTYKKKLNLDLALQEYNKRKNTGERKPTLSTDEEESGSSTSSCDEMERTIRPEDTSDTASAPSPNQILIDENPLKCLAETVVKLSEKEKDDCATLSVNNNAGAVAAGSMECSAVSVVTRAPSANGQIMKINQSNSNVIESHRNNATPVITSYSVKEDYDSSATETADEGVGCIADGDTSSSNKSTTPFFNTTSVIERNRQQDAVSSSDLTFKNILFGVIEMQLKKPQNSTSSTSPQVDSSQSERDLYEQKSRDNPSLATLSVVNPSKDHHMETAKESLVSIQMQQSGKSRQEVIREPEGVTLDLSIKKPRTSPEFNNMNNNQRASPSQAVTINLSQSNQQPFKQHQPMDQANNYYHPHQLVELTRVNKAGEPLYLKIPPGRQIVMQPHPSLPLKQQPPHIKIPNKVSPSQSMNQSIKLSPNSLGPSSISASSSGVNNNVIGNSTIVVNHQTGKLGGSIMHGTPVSNSNAPPPGVSYYPRYEHPSLIRQMPQQPPAHNKDPNIGSITQGTPVHQRNNHGNTPVEYFPHAAPKRPTAITASGFYPPRPPTYSAEQQQIFFNDYLTSQQISSPLHRNPDPAFYYPPQRKGVIQRLVPNSGTVGGKPSSSSSSSPHSSTYPPGHEALGSLADVAIRQHQGLPVTLHQPISTSSSSVIRQQHKPEDNKTVIIQEGLADRFQRETILQERFNREQERYARDGPMHHQSHEQQIREQQMRQHQHHQQQQQQHQQQQIRENHMLQQQKRDREREREREREHREREIHQQEVRDRAMGQMYREMDHHGKPPSHQRVDNHLDHSQPSPYHHQNNRIPPPPPPQQTQQQQPMVYQTSQPTDNRIMQQTAATNYHRESPTAQHAKLETNNRNTPVGAGGRPAADSSTLTAASLIDAIITHQINQTNEPVLPTSTAQQPTPPCIPTQRPADKLFQVFPEPSEKGSPLKGTVQCRDSPELKQQTLPQVNSQHQSLPNNSTDIDRNNHQQPPAAQMPPHGFVDAHRWKLRQALQQKEMEQSERNIVRMATNQMPPSPRQRYLMAESPAPLSPLDYVKNKIVEVMRTSEEDAAKGPASPNFENEGERRTPTSSEQQQAPPPPPSGSHASPYIAASNYTYPYSALNINSQLTPSVMAAHNATIITQHKSSLDIPEPAPLLSAQYEPLSDEE